MGCGTKLLAATAVLALAMPAAQAAPIEIQFWHAMTAVNAEMVNKLADEFNKSQSEYKVVPVHKGSYAETMNADIAAFRAGKAPAIVQIFEVGTATMMAAKGAVKPVYQLMAESGLHFDPKAYIPAVSGYYSTADGKMLSLPFNSSTAVAYYNKDLFKKAGLDPNKPPKTWPEWLADARKIHQSGTACGFTLGWISWTQIEQFSAWHNIPLATLANGMKGPGAVLKFNAPLDVRHIQDLVKAVKDGSFQYGGRTTQPEAKFMSGECGLIQTSSGAYGKFKKNAKFDFGVFNLPYYPDVKGAPQNSIIGGASLWVMGGKSKAEYKGVAEFFNFISQTPQQIDFHKTTGYLPITTAAYETLKKEGFYKEHPALEVPILELTNKEPTENSRGLRLGNLVKIRDIIDSQLESAFSGKVSAKQALDTAVERGNAILRQFQAATK